MSGRNQSQNMTNLKQLRDKIAHDLREYRREMREARSWLQFHKMAVAKAKIDAMRKLARSLNR